MPATDAVMMTDDGVLTEACFPSSGANLREGTGSSALYAHKHHASIAETKDVTREEAESEVERERKWDAQSYGIEDALDVQIHYFRKHGIGVRIEWLAPRRACVRK